MPAISPLPIIDAHHHYWDPVTNYHPWLRDEPMIPFRYGDYSLIRKRFMPAEYAKVAENYNVAATVTMEGEWDETDPVAESAWITKVAEQHHAPAAHVARAFLHQADAPDILSQHAAYPIVRGIRHKPTSAANPDAIEKGAPGSMSDPKWRAGYANLAANNLHFELQAPWWHVEELMELIELFPETPVVINHAFMPVDRSPDALKAWRNALRLASTAPQVVLKISGIGIEGRNWTLDDQRPVIDACIDTFSPTRCIFASNFPVDGLTGSFDDIYGGFLAATADLPRADRLAMFHDNAIKIYRLDLRPAHATAQ